MPLTNLQRVECDLCACKQNIPAGKDVNDVFDTINIPGYSGTPSDYTTKYVCDYCSHIIVQKASIRKSKQKD